MGKKYRRKKLKVAEQERGEKQGKKRGYGSGGKHGIEGKGMGEELPIEREGTGYGRMRKGEEGKVGRKRGERDKSDRERERKLVEVRVCASKGKGIQGGGRVSVGYITRGEGRKLVAVWVCGVRGKAVKEEVGVKWWCVGVGQLEAVSKGVWSGWPSCVSGYLAGSGYRPRRQVLRRSHATLANLQ